MDEKIFDRAVWKPCKGKYIVEVEDYKNTLVDTPYGKRKPVFIKVNGQPHVWLINHYHKAVEKSVETQLEAILTRSKAAKKLIKVTVDDDGVRKFYDLREVENAPESVIVSLGVYVSDDEGEYHLIHSDAIPIGGENE